MRKQLVGGMAAVLLCGSIAAVNAAPVPLVIKLEDWKNVPTPNHDDTEKKKRVEPPATIESKDGVLKVTFDGGEWPTVAAPAPDANWNDYRSLHADITVPRDCVIGFRIMQEKSLRGGDWDPTVSRWDYTQFLQAGKNHIAAPLGDADRPAFPEKRGKVTSIEFYMYAPHKGETVQVENLSLTSDAVPAEPKQQVNFKVLGTDLTVKSVDELLKTMRHHWTKPAQRTVDQVETDFRAKFDELKKTHPNAVMAIFRDGEKGWNPADPDKAYDGWRDAHVNSHGPDGNLDGRAAKTGKRSWSEVFMRHRSRIMKIDVSSIPAGSSILAAEMMLVRLDKIDEKSSPANHATMWVAEACNRDWDEAEVNAYQYARDKFWKAIGGQYYGDDPDFLPLYLAHGPSQGSVNTWNFTEAVKYWTDGQNKNHGFFWHTTPEDYWPGNTPTRETAKIKDRPALMVIYEPAPK